MGDDDVHKKARSLVEKNSHIIRLFKNPHCFGGVDPYSPHFNEQEFAAMQLLVRLDLAYTRRHNALTERDGRFVKRKGNVSEDDGNLWVAYDYTPNALLASAFLVTRDFLRSAEYQASEEVVTAAQDIFSNIMVNIKNIIEKGAAQIIEALASNVISSNSMVSNCGQGLMKKLVLNEELE